MPDGTARAHYIIYKGCDFLNRTVGIIELFITAIIWGTAFVAQSIGMDYIGPLAFNGARYAVGSFALIPVIIIIGRIKRKKAGTSKKEKAEQIRKNELQNTIKGGVFCGLIITAASLLQQYGLLYTTVGKAAFGTALYIIIVPFLAVLLHKKITGNVWIAAIIAIVGFYLMCASENMGIGKGDALVLLGAVMWSVHIHTVDYFAPKSNGVMLSAIQFGVSAIICFSAAFIFEHFTLSDIINGAIPILYAGVLSCGVAYTLQIIAQQKVEPSLACLIMSFEAVISAVTGWIILGEAMGFVEILGCTLVFLGVILAQLPERRKVEVEEAY